MVQKGDPPSISVALDLTHVDLEANRRGILSASQAAKMTSAMRRLNAIATTATVAGMLVALILSLVLGLPSTVKIAIIGGSLLAGVGLLLAIKKLILEPIRRDVEGASVNVIEGEIQRPVSLGRRGYALWLEGKRYTGGLLESDTPARRSAPVLVVGRLLNKGDKIRLFAAPASNVIVALERMQ